MPNGTLREQHPLFVSCQLSVVFKTGFFPESVFRQVYLISIKNLARSSQILTSGY
jgi:hypothetical protein